MCSRRRKLADYRAVKSPRTDVPPESAQVRVQKALQATAQSRIVLFGDVAY